MDYFKSMIIFCQLPLKMMQWRVSCRFFFEMRQIHVVEIDPCALTNSRTVS
jgi:hypothetical protein